MQKESPVTPPRRNQLPVIQKFIAAYKLWHEFVPHIPKTSRYTLGSKIDLLLLEIIEYIFSAASVTQHERLVRINSATTRLDLLKFFLQVAWEIKALDTKKYIILSEKLDETGRMLGGWIKQLLQKTSPR